MILDKTSKERAISDDNHDFVCFFSSIKNCLQNQIISNVISKVQEDGSIIVDSDSEEGASNQPDAILDDMDDDVCLFSQSSIRLRCQIFCDLKLFINRKSLLFDCI